MGAGSSDGIADDASDYENLAEPEQRASPGIADDAELFADMLDEGTDAARRLDSDWLYQENGQVFGPIKAKELVEMLYRWEITPDTEVAPDGGEFRALRRIGVFQKHVQKADEHQAKIKKQKAKDKVETRRRWTRNAMYAVVGLGILAGGGFGVATLVRSQRESAAEEERLAKEKALKDQLASLEASVIIEPPLLPLVEEEQPSTKSKKSRRRRGRRRARGSQTDVSKSGAVGDLSRREIMGGVSAAFPTIKKCIIAQMQRDPESVSQQIVMRFSVNNAGRAQQVSLTDRFLRKSPLRPCLAGALAKVKWRAYTGEVRNIDYPISVGRR